MLSALHDRNDHSVWTNTQDVSGHTYWRIWSRFKVQAMTAVSILTNWNSIWQTITGKWDMSHSGPKHTKHSLFAYLTSGQNMILQPVAHVYECPAWMWTPKQLCCFCASFSFIEECLGPTWQVWVPGCLKASKWLFSKPNLAASCENKNVFFSLIMTRNFLKQSNHKTRSVCSFSDSIDWNCFTSGEETPPLNCGCFSISPLLCLILLPLLICVCVPPPPHFLILRLLLYISIVLPFCLPCSFSPWNNVTLKWFYF